MNWICLYAVESGPHRWLFYGYATAAAGLPAALWFESDLDVRGPGWRLLRYSRGADDQELDALRASLRSNLTTTLTLRGADAQQVQLDHGPLCDRPAVYAVPRVFDPS